MVLKVPANTPPQNRHAVAIRVTRRVRFLFFIFFECFLGGETIDAFARLMVPLRASRASLNGSNPEVLIPPFH
jgi:hypothetical protein